MKKSPSLRAAPGLLLGLALALSGCASAGRDTGLVFPRTDGTIEIVSGSYTGTRAQWRAVNQAKRTCAEMQKTYVVLSNQVSYHGILTEDANRLARTIGKNITDMTGAPVPTTSTSEDYKASLIIRCV